MENIIDEANRCLSCKVRPCSKACPLGNDIPSFIKQVKENNLEEAFKILTQTTVLGAICGRVCPHFKQCMGSCVRGIKSEPINIGNLETYIFDNALQKNYKIETTNKIEGKKVAVIGGGPSGLTCAAFLSMNGAKVTIYEKQPKLGGITRYGIPDFRLPREVIDKTVEKILSLGIEAKCNQTLGKDYELVDIEKQYDAVYLSVGANVSSKMNIPGEDLDGVYGGNELLETGIHPDYTGKSVAVSGGGNVAMDAARTIKRLGAKNVYVIYRRAREQMPAEDYEVEEAMKEGVEFLFQNNIVKIIGNDKKIIRTMPNTPALVNCGMSSLSPNKNIEKNDIDAVKTIFDSFGKSEIVDESLIDVVIGASGSSPAYAFMFIEAMADCAVSYGMKREMAYEFCAQAVMGAAKMVLETKKHPGELKDMVCSPGGTTIEAVKTLENEGMRSAVINGMASCIEKSIEMSK